MFSMKGCSMDFKFTHIACPYFFLKGLYFEGQNKNLLDYLIPIIAVIIGGLISVLVTRWMIFANEKQHEEKLRYDRLKEAPYFNITQNIQTFTEKVNLRSIAYVLLIDTSNKQYEIFTTSVLINNEIIYFNNNQSIYCNKQEIVKSKSGDSSFSWKFVNNPMLYDLENVGESAAFDIGFTLFDPKYKKLNPQNFLCLSKKSHFFIIAFINDEKDKGTFNICISYKDNKDRKYSQQLSYTISQLDSVDFYVPILSLRRDN